VSPVVRAVADLPGVPDAVGRKEFAYGLTFNPRQLDEVCWAGYFPMSINVGIPVPAIKWCVRVYVCVCWGGGVQGIACFCTAPNAAPVLCTVVRAVRTPPGTQAFSRIQQA
jgi:hypothetical protein